MSAHPLRVSVTEPLGPALRRVKTVLFAPFDLRKWFVIGFCAWLSSCGESGGGGGGGGGGNSGRHPVHADDVRHGVEKAWGYIVDNLAWIVPLVILGLLLCATLWLVATWLNSHGKFMLLHCVALNRAEVQVPWERYGPHARSLFLFQALLGALAFVLIFPIVTGSGAMLLLAFMREAPLLGPGILFALGILVAIGLGMLVAVVKKLLVDFVVPIMCLRTPSVRAAWREFLSLGSSNAGRFVLYLLFSLVLSMIIVTLIFIVIIATCCVAGCLMAIPYIGAVLLLPVYVFKRAYSLCYLEQYGTEFGVIDRDERAAVSPG